MSSKHYVTAAAIALTASLLAGCGSDGVELNGKIFDMMGVSESAKAANAREPRVPQRAGLVMPPDVNRLPEPGSDVDAQDATAQLNDPEKKKALAAAERERLHKAYCSGEMTWKDRAMKKDGSDVLKSPYGSCSVLSGMINQ